MKKLIQYITIWSILIACSNKEIKWVALGDSITYLNDHKDKTDNRVTKGYITRVVEALPQFDYTNKGKNGWTAIRVAQEIENLELRSADVYTIFLGTNDWWVGKPIGDLQDYVNDTGSETFYGAYRIIVNKILTLKKDARIILITPMQRSDFVYWSNFKNQAYGSYREKDGQSQNFRAAKVDINFWGRSTKILFNII